MLNRETLNVIQLGIGLCLLFTAISSQGFIVETVMANKHEEDPRFSSHAGTATAAVFYLISNIISPPIIKFLSPKWSLIASAAGVSVYMTGFIFLEPYSLYFYSMIMGQSGGFMWTSSACYLAQNSNEETIGRNSGIMWIFFMCSMVIGGIFLLLMFSSSMTEYISSSLTRNVYSGFLAFSLAAFCCFALLPQKPQNKANDEKQEGGYLNELAKSVYLIKTTDMLLLLPLFAFTGLEPCFYSVVYATALSFTSAFAINTNVLIAWSSIFTGLGQITAGIPLILLGKRSHRYGFTPCVLIGCVFAIVASVMVAINIPGNATYERTNEESLLTPSIPIALIAAFIFGVSECFVSTAIYSFLSIRYPDESAQAFAIMKFVNAFPTIGCIYFGATMQLQWQLLILVICSILMVVGFATAESRYKTIKL